ncbi:sulfotransferase family protein [Streptomyces sp. NPDC057743]|uniref:sulfotransferase family protein n=1 Tax=Streptomyces sp. NPDC057743 TaxID=3346236 RepID=UPI0036865B53
MTPDAAPPRRKVFCLGLSRTGTRSVAEALRTLGHHVLHYPSDRAALDTLHRGDARFPHLDHCAGLADITVVPYYPQLDRLWPGSRFVLTLRDEDDWLRSCRTHWARHPVDTTPTTEKARIKLEVKRFLRAAVYGGYDFHEDRFRTVHRHHVDAVRRYFAGRDDDLLLLRPCAGEGYERLAPFLGVPTPPGPFPHVG